MSRCGECGAAVRYVIVDTRYVTVNHHMIAVEPAPHPAGTIACPTDRYKSLAYLLDRGEAPARGYTRHRRHTHGEKAP